MPDKQQSPSKEEVNSKIPAFYGRHHLPPVEPAKSGPKTVKVYGWDIVKGKLEPVVKGERDPFADIQAAKQETLSEMLDRMGGRTPTEKVRNAVNAGLIIQDNMGKSAKYADLTNMPDSYVDAFNQIKKGEAAVASLPDDFKNGKTDLNDILSLFTEDQLKAYLASKQPKPTEGGAE